MKDYEKPVVEVIEFVSENLMDGGVNENPEISSGNSHLPNIPNT